MKFNEYVQINEGLTMKEKEERRVETLNRKANEKQYIVLFRETKEKKVMCESDLMHLVSCNANIIFSEC